MTRKNRTRTRPTDRSTGTVDGDTSTEVGTVADAPAPTPPAQRGRCDRQAAAIDIPTIVTVLYVDLMGPAEWTALGPGRMAAYITTVAADPQFRVPALVELVAMARARGTEFIVTDRMAAAEAFAPAVHMAAMANGRIGR